jgi:ribosomal protein S18 acetylase RimI-like enzyme
VARDQRDIAGTGQGHVTRGDARDPSAGPIDGTPGYPAQKHDSDTLREALLEAVSTSPGRFLATTESILEKSVSYWAADLQESVWVVVEQDSKVVGLAAAKQPYGEDSWKYDKISARFIESVWIDPSMRRRGLGDRIVRYLIEQQRLRDPRAHQFYLWVFADNKPAIALYEQMGFTHTLRSSFPPGRAIPELQYLLNVYSATGDDDELSMTEGNYELKYRVLGAK